MYFESLPCFSALRCLIQCLGYLAYKTGSQHTRSLINIMDPLRQIPNRRLISCILIVGELHHVRMIVRHRYPMFVWHIQLG
jgi:hypothetical protein